MTTDTPSFNRAANASAVLTSLMVGDKVDGTAVASATATISGAGQKLDNQIHGTAVACIMLSMSIQEGGPASGAGPAVNLLNAMPRGSRAKALSAWFTAFSNIRCKLNAKSKQWEGGVLPATAKTYAVPDPKAAMDRPFWTAEEKDVTPSVFTTDKFKARVKALLAAAKADNAELDDEGKALLAGIEAATAPKAPASLDVLEIEGEA